MRLSHRRQKENSLAITDEMSVYLVKYGLEWENGSLSCCCKKKKKEELQVETKKRAIKS